MLEFLGGNPDDSNWENLGTEAFKKTNKVIYSPREEQNNNDVKGVEKIQDKV